MSARELGSRPITTAQPLAPRRIENSGENLWRPVDRVQENAIRGDLAAWGRGAQDRPRRAT